MKSNRAKNFSSESPTLYIGGLSYSCTEDSIRQHFSPYGTVTGVRLAVDRDTGRPKGFAHIDFINVNEARNAMTKLDGSEIEGRRIRLDFAGGKGSSNSRSSSRKASKHDSGTSRFDTDEFPSSTKAFDNNGGNRHQGVSNSELGWGSEPATTNTVAADQGWGMQPLKTEKMPISTASSGWGEDPVSYSGITGWGGEPAAMSASGAGWGAEPLELVEGRFKQDFSGWGENVNNSQWNEVENVDSPTSTVLARDNPLDPRVKKRKLLSSLETPFPSKESSGTSSKENLKECYEFEPAEFCSNENDLSQLMSDTTHSSLRCATKRSRFRPTFDFSVLKSRR